MDYGDSSADIKMIMDEGIALKREKGYGRMRIFELGDCYFCLFDKVVFKDRDYHTTMPRCYYKKSEVWEFVDRTFSNPAEYLPENFQPDRKF